GYTPSGIPIAAMIGDQQGALFGQMCFEPGQAKCTYGTGAFLLMNVGNEPKFSENQLLTTIAWKAGEELVYAMEGSVFICGASIDWIVNELGLASTPADTEQMSYNVRDNGGVYFVPALSGLGAPYWDPQARGLWIGMTQSTNKNHLVRSVLEGIAYSVRGLSDTVVADCGIPLKELKIDGGVSKNAFLHNYQSTVLGLPVLRPKNTETTATGAACLAGLAVGFWKDRAELRKLWEMDRLVHRQKEAEVEKQYANWKKAVTRSLDWVCD
ncbi:MAG TPA: FGGY-family carbohydrate kinase, partial [Thermotogota bacterium]|nr:FGGY-family carbohydrate kinase [Thermotogota bacterium]